MEEIAQRHPALFLIDYTLPGIHGLALYQHLHAREEMKNVPAVLLTGSARPEVLQEAEQRKICVLIKPFDLDQLLDLVERETTPSEQFS